MKKFIFLAVVLLTTTYLSAQRVTWIFVSGGGGYGTSLFYNESELNMSEITYDILSPSYFYGGKLGFIAGQGIGLSLGLRQNKLSQGYTIENNSQTQYVLANVKTFDINILLNLQSETGFYFNIGPEFATTKNASLFIKNINNTETRDITDKITPKLSGLTFEAGLKPLRTDYFEINFGFFGTFYFTDLTSEPGYFLAIHDRTFFNPSLNDHPVYTAQLGASLEFIWIFARYGKASCGKQRFMINGF